MPSLKNINQLEQLKQKLATAKSICLADYSGLSVSKQQQLREAINAAGGLITVVKNNLLKIALNETISQTKTAANQPTINQALTGPTILLIAQKDEIGPLKALVQFTQQHDLPRLKLGLLTDRILSIAEVEQLAQLPTTTELLAQLIGTLKNPLSQLVYILKGNQQKLVQVLHAISQRQTALASN